MNSTPTISVIIPAHPRRINNGMLNRALTSVQAQTLLPHEIIVEIDVDGTGAPATRDRALRKATCDWVAFLDSDDLFMPEHLYKLLQHALVTGADYVYSWYELLDANGKLLGDRDPVFPPGHFLNEFDPANPVETTITVLMRRQLAQEIGFRPAAEDGGTNPGANTGEDRRMVHEVIKRGGKITHLVDRTWIWHHHGLNTSGLPTKGDGPKSMVYGLVGPDGFALNSVLEP